MTIFYRWAMRIATPTELSLRCCMRVKTQMSLSTDVMINFASKKFRDVMMKQCLIFTQDIKTTAYEVKIIGFVFGFIEGQKADLKKSDSFSIELQGKIRYDFYLFNYIIININIDRKRGFGVLGLMCTWNLATRSSWCRGLTR